MKTLNSPSHKVWTLHGSGIAAIVIATVVVGYFGGRPLQQAYATSAQNAEVMHLRQTKRTEIQTQYRNLENDLKVTKATLAKSKLQLLPITAINERLASLAALGQAHQLEIEEIVPGEIFQEPFYDMRRIHLKGSATYKSFSTFLREAHERCPDIGILSFNIEAHDARAEHSARFNITLNWYAQASHEKNVK